MSKANILKVVCFTFVFVALAADSVAHYGYSHERMTSQGLTSADQFRELLAVFANPFSKKDESGNTLTDAISIEELTAKIRCGPTKPLQSN